MADFDTLKRMIRVGATEPLQWHYRKRKAVLPEGADTGRYSIEINNVPEDALVIDVDKNLEVRLFSSAEGAGKRVDFMIVSEAEKTILFIEMKKGNVDKPAIIRQLKGGLCVFEYCQSVAREFYGEKRFLSDYKKRYVVFSRIFANKKQVRRKATGGAHDTPEKALWLKHRAAVRFNELMA